VPDPANFYNHLEHDRVISDRFEHESTDRRGATKDAFCRENCHERRTAMFKNILVATDGSDDACRAAEWAADIAERCGSRVVIATVYAPPMMVAETAAYALTPAEIAEIQMDIIERTGEALTKRKVAFESRTDTGNPAACIISMAEQEQCDLIVLGSHGVGGIRRFLLGSVSDRIGHYAHCSVMIVKRETLR
jgi:nucleotide-binding universal stress UspA family protein